MARTTCLGTRTRRYAGWRLRPPCQLCGHSPFKTFTNASRHAHVLPAAIHASMFPPPTHCFCRQVDVVRKYGLLRCDYFLASALPCRSGKAVLSLRASNHKRATPANSAFCNLERQPSVYCVANAPKPDDRSVCPTGPVDEHLFRTMPQVLFREGRQHLHESEVNGAP